MRRLCLECSAVISHLQGSRCAKCLAAFEQRLQARKNAEFGGSGGRWQTIRRQVFERQEGRCARCGNELGSSYAVDHVVPRYQFRGPRNEARGEASELSNLQALCVKPCHEAKTAEDQANRRKWSKRKALVR